ncbi:Hypothetical protein NTJ_05406 [Nesidiocoris tenuis]|uniref:Uncharacterized protein n=1 Tax=Nesidiocoris tenuis TaxID=355587 RepID=A0ABN7AMR1_9HEMI|nr:Hypothetical protein NTJ_05406 [Nesidiocoris tenuis]
MGSAAPVQANQGQSGKVAISFRTDGRIGEGSGAMRTSCCGNVLYSNDNAAAVVTSLVCLPINGPDLFLTWELCKGSCP